MAHLLGWNQVLFWTCGNAFVRQSHSKWSPRLKGRNRHDLPSDNEMKLGILDVDQTLVDFLSVHDEVTRRVFKRSFNVDARLTEIDFTGKSLVENFSKLARLK